MKIVFFFLALVLASARPGAAQDYTTAAGFRGGLFAGVTVKHFIGKNTAIEGIASTRWRGFDITGLYEIHNPAFGIEGLSWYYGGGGHIGFYDGTHANWASTNNAYTVIGIDGIIGLEYVFKR